MCLLTTRQISCQLHGPVLHSRLLSLNCMYCTLTYLSMKLIFFLLLHGWKFCFRGTGNMKNLDDLTNLFNHVRRSHIYGLGCDCPISPGFAPPYIFMHTFLTTSSAWFNTHPYSPSFPPLFKIKLYHLHLNGRSTPLLRPRLRGISWIRPLRPDRRRRARGWINPDNMIDAAITLQGWILVQRPGRLRRRLRAFGNGNVGVAFGQLGPCPGCAFAPEVD